jgi:hypothetical protein
MLDDNREKNIDGGYMMHEARNEMLEVCWGFFGINAHICHK